VTDGTNHPQPETLEMFAGGELPGADGAVVESHLLGCGRCRGEVEEWRHIFHSLAALPAYAPAAGFADRVMAGVRIPHPWHVQVRAWAGAALPRLVPSTPSGWAAVAALLIIPALVGAIFLVWLLSHPQLTAEGLLAFTADRSAAAVGAAFSGALHWLMTTDLVARLLGIGAEIVDLRGVAGVGALMASMGAAVALSLWILYTNLVRTPTREATYVSYSI
jgi:hypothetical protein